MEDNLVLNSRGKFYRVGMNSPDPKPMMSLDKFMEQTGLSPSTLWRWRKKSGRSPPSISMGPYSTTRDHCGARESSSPDNSDIPMQKITPMTLKICALLQERSGPHRWLCQSGALVMYAQA
jgi:predicted DNA-binding transcriptional regulator AlpA